MPTSPLPVSLRFVPGRRAAAAPARAAGPITRHLILAYRPGWQSIEDLNAIADHVSDIEPTIRTFIVPTTLPNSVSRKLAARLPTLVVSPGRMSVFRPLRGKVYQGWPIPKIEEVRRLEKAGLPVPRTEILTPELRLDPLDWGDFVIVKPTDIATSSHGRGIQLMRPKRVRYIPPEEYPADHPGRLGPMMVQQFVPTGDKLELYRVLAFFGEPLYLQLTRSGDRPLDLAAGDDVIESLIVANQGYDKHERYFVNEPEVVALARAAHAAIPEVPLKGCDIIRDVRTGKLCVLELNCGGNTWHFSSDFLADIRKDLGPEFELRRRQQFDYARTAARVLVARTKAEAE